MAADVLAEGEGPVARSPGSDLDALVSRLVDALEDRVLQELERRGRRGTPGVF
jgi:hypothetical protein